MPSTFSVLDTGLPAFTGGETTEQKVAALYDYTFMLLENLRYILRNLSSDNFTDSGVEELGEALVRNDAVMQLLGDTLNVTTVITQEMVTEELYADYGAVADLVVDELRTDYQKAARYLAGDTSAIDYLHIHDEEIDFLTGTVRASGGVPLTEQLHHGARYFWWADEERSRMTGLKSTPWPVMVYQYDELQKAAFAFKDYTTTQGVRTRAPVLTLGAGDGYGRSIGYIFKDQSEFVLRFVTDAGENTDVRLGDFVDAKHRRLRSCAIDTAGGEVAYTLEGDEAEHGLSFTVDGDTVTYTWPDGFECEVRVT